MGDFFKDVLTNKFYNTETYIYVYPNVLHTNRYIYELIL